MIAHSSLCAGAFLEAPMSPRAYGPLFASTLGVAVPKGTIHDSSLLIKGQTGSLTIGCVSKQVPSSAVEAKGTHIGACAVGCFVASFALGEGYIPFSV